MPRKKRKPLFEGFELVPETTGKICAGVYLKEDNTELIVHFAWGRDLHFKPVDKSE